MTKAEQRLLTLVARMVIRIAKNLGYEDTAREVEGQLLETSHELVRLEAEATFEDAVMALEDSGMDASLQHTGGGIYVLWHRLNDDPAGPCVGITPDDLHPGFWTVVSYRDNQDEGFEVRNEVSLVGLVDVVYELARNLVGTFHIPGSFSAQFHADGGVKFTFLPAAGDAGYFGPAMINSENGEELSLDDANILFDKIGFVLGPEGRFTGHWES